MKFYQMNANKVSAKDDISSKKGNLGIAIGIGSLIMALIGWIPIIGAMVSGLLSGIIARGYLRGGLAALLSGIIGIIIFSAIASVLRVNIESIFGPQVEDNILYFYQMSIILAIVMGLFGGSVKKR